MLGQIGGRWLDRLLQQLCKELRAQGWTQMQIAKATGSTQSTVSRQISKPVIKLGATADEATVDGWSKGIGGLHGTVRARSHRGSATVGV